MSRRQPVFLSFTLLLLSYTAVAASPAELDALVKQWLTLEHQQAQLQQDWHSRKHSLQQGIALLQAEKQQLSRMLNQKQQQQDEVDARRASLLAEQQMLEQQQQLSQQQLQQLLTRLKLLQPQLPPPLAAGWQQELNGLDANSEPGLLLQRLLLALTKLADFQSRLTPDEITLSAQNGQQVRVRVLYLGASQGWFVSADGQYRGTGYASGDSWQWQFDNSIDAEPLLQALAVIEKRQDPSLIALPITLPDMAASNGAQP